MKLPAHLTPILLTNKNQTVQFQVNLVSLDAGRNTNDVSNIENGIFREGS